MSRKLVRAGVWAVLGWITLLGWNRGSGGAAAEASRPLSLAPCHLEGLAEEARCGVWEVWEDRRAGQGRRISIHVAVLPSWARRPAPDPLVLLAGGPGQGGRSLAALAETVFRKLRRERDLVLVDLRGTGASGRLDCPLKGGELALLASDGFFPMDVAACARRQIADPRLYTSETMMADLDEVRAALGYERINLWGGSYGTRAALVYARLFPERLRAVVLDGAAPLDLRFPLSVAADGQRALDRLLADCAADQACKAAYPRLGRQLAELLAALEHQPAAVELAHPRTGERRRLAVDRDGLGAAVRGALYSPRHASLLPLAISAAHGGDFAPFATLASETAAWSVETMALGLTLSVLCSEDVWRIEPEEIAPATAGTFLRAADIETWRRYCADWPHERALAGGDDVRPLPAPALILSGGLDPVTPPRWGEAMARHFPAHRHVVVEGAGHNVSFSGCVPDLIAEFLAAGRGDHLETGCVAAIRRPPFVVRPAGTEP